MSSNQFRAKLLAIQSNLYNFAYTLTTNRDDANDLLQDTTLKVLDNEEKYVDNINFKGWAFTIMRNLFINHYRKRSRCNVISDSSDDLYLLNMPQDSGYETPEGAISVIEIHKVIDSFSDDYRIPFSMHLQGYKYAEIAEHTGLPLGTVKSRIYFARQRLQTALGDFRAG